MWFKQLEKLCTANNTTPTTFVKKELGLSSSKVTAWKNGSIPKFEILKQIADYFNVTVGYLFDGKEQNPSSDLTDEELELLDKFRHLLEIDKGRILDRMETIYAGYSPEQKENVS